jgi:hypothetical protein
MIWLALSLKEYLEELEIRNNRTRENSWIDLVSFKNGS